MSADKLMQKIKDTVKPGAVNLAFQSAQML